MMTFEQQLKKVAASLTAGNQKIALVIIDVQRDFCDPTSFGSRRGNAETKQVATRIAELAPEFRKAGIPVYAVYFGIFDKKSEDIDFYQFKPAPEDKIVRKNANSAFKHGGLKPALEQDGRTLLLTCGFNLNACVYKTVLDARERGYAVTLLRDLCGNDNNHKPEDENPQVFVDVMAHNGVAIEQSADVLKQLTAKRSAP